jgi:L-gulonolactone oxidase
MPNLGDIAYQTISGAISTSTHGTGSRLTGIAGQVAGLRLVNGHGEVVDINGQQNPELLDVARVGVGALGIVTQVTLNVVPAFRLRAVEGAQKLDALIENLDELVDSNEHFEFFWIPHTRWALTKRNNRTTDPVHIPSRAKQWYSKTFLENYAFGAVCALGRLRPSLIPRLATALPSSGQTEIVDESFRIFASERIVKFVEMEYAIPRQYCGEALQRIRKMIDDKGYLISFPVEVRFTAKDDIALSTASGRDSAYIAVHMYKGMDYEPYFRDVANIMSDYEGRPHWGKMHFLNHNELSKLYPRWNDFIVARETLDPHRTFANTYTNQVFGE